MKQVTLKSAEIIHLSAFDRLKHKPCICKECPFGGGKVGARGNPKAPIIIIGEGPGVQELRQGLPFIGPSGKVLWETIPGGEDLVKEGLVYVTNALKCFVQKKKQGQGSDTKLIKAIKTCRAQLIQEVSAHPRKLIITLGNTALWAVTNNFDYRITQDRGNPIPSKYAELGIFPAVHPAALLRGTGNYRQFKEDMRYALHLAKGGDRKVHIKPTEIILCDTDDKIAKAIYTLEQQEYLAADTETTGFSFRQNVPLCLGIAHRPDQVYVFPADTILKLKPLFDSDWPKWIWHNGKFDIKFLRYHFGLAARVDEDTMLLSYALDESSGIHDLEQIGKDLLGAPDYKYIVRPYAPKKSDSYEKVPKPILYKYLALDVSITLQIFSILRQQVASDAALDRLYTKLLIPASEMLTHVEMNGIAVNQEQVSKNEERLTKEVELLHGKIQELAHRPINPNSPVQIAELLYNDLKLPIKHGRTTNKEVLAKLPKHPVVVALLRYRKAQKAVSTYVKSIWAKVQDDGRIYSTFLIHGTRTGRLSSNKPNLQNIPRDPELRSMFCAALGYILLEFDLDQAELRSLAGCSDDSLMIQIYSSAHKSLHDETCEAIWKDYDKAEAKIPGSKNSERRMRAKAVNFGIVYGREAPSLAEEFNITIKEATRWISAWFDRFPKARDFIMRCRRAVLKAQTITTPFGRKKRHLIVSAEKLKALMNEAANFPHQSIASDITLYAACQAQPFIERLGARIVNLVHDSILVECPDKARVKAKVRRIVIREMQIAAVTWGITRVPFIADVKEGNQWGILKKTA